VERPDTYDAIVIGSGQGGGPLAGDLARAGYRTALVERKHIGGTCINEGCTPTKTMVASARVAYLAGRAADYGVAARLTGVDMPAVRQRKRDIVASFRQSSTQSLKEAGVELIFGEARFTGPKQLEVSHEGHDGRRLQAEWIFIDTGSRPVDPPLPGLDGVPHLNSTTIMELDEVPDHLLVLGGGYVGVEFGQMFRRFGSAVTIVQQGAQLLAREDADIARAVADILEEDGITVLLSASAQRTARGETGGVSLDVQTSDGERTVRGSHLLVAVGRAPNTEALDLDRAGIEVDQRGFIKADDRLETSAPGVYALGEVAGSPAFTHISYDDYRIIRDNLLRHGRRTRSDRLVPYTVFIDPQLGRVGAGEDELRKAGREVRIARMPMTSVARALEVGESRGMVKAVVDGRTDQILGCSVLGLEGGEVMAMIEIAMMGKLPYTALRDGIFAHPTLAELLNTLFSSLEEAPSARGESA